MAHYTSLIARPQSFDPITILRNEFHHDVLYVFTLCRDIRRVNTCNFNIFSLDSLHFDPYESIVLKGSMVGN